ncbi:transposase [Streptomyces sp. NBC_00133]|uniref:transposase n=1 Tax=Streptomyces sp. NBC_00133 TaxID=2903624 RepID=UPI003862EC34
MDEHRQGKPAHTLFRIVDNRSFHRGRTASGRLTGAFPNAVMVHTPVHASWLNQVELFFSVVQRRWSRRTISAT